MTLQLNLDIHGELIIDNFAGGGGASTGIELALGRRVDIAINHDPEAVAMHTANHPETKHYCESVWEIDPREVTQGRPVGLVWLPPDCKHFSKAKGGKPVEKKIRGLAWVALRWAAVAKPRVIMLENVEEFQTWGPLVIDTEGNAYPCPKNKGRTFKSFVNALRRQGYAVEWRELRACDYGTPTIRKRLFLIARRDGLPIVWPTPTHGDPRNIATKAKKLKPWRTAAECIDWSIPCPSIFERKRELAPATLRRIAKGIMRYVVNAAEPFIVPLTHHGADRRTGLEQPMPTVTAAHRGEMALIAPVLTEHANASTPRCMPADEPLRTICAQTKGGQLVATYYLPVREKEEAPPLYAAPVPAQAPGGWELKDCGDGHIIVRKDGVGGYVSSHNGENIASTILHALAADLLAAAPTPPLCVSKFAESETQSDDAKDSARYRALRRGQHWSVINGIGDDLRGEELDAAIDALKCGAA